MLRRWEDLPPEMQTEAVRKYYDILRKKQGRLLIKRLFDIVVALILLLALAPVFLFLAVAIKLDSPGPVFYRQTRVTRYGKHFRIFKFRTMTADADKIGTHVTVKNDVRITRVGRLIRKYRLDEISQLIDVLRGAMTFVGTRPEAVKYAEHYTPEMKATWLLPAGVTGLACIRYKDEADLLSKAKDADQIYIEKILPDKMYYNLRELENFSLSADIIVMIKTVLAVL